MVIFVTKGSKRRVEIEGKFLLSLDDCEGVRTSFSTLYFLAVSLTYTSGTGKDLNAKEVVISNKADRLSERVTNKV